MKTLFTFMTMSARCIKHTIKTFTGDLLTFSRMRAFIQISIVIHGIAIAFTLLTFTELIPKEVYALVFTFVTLIACIRLNTFVAFEFKL